LFLCIFLLSAAAAQAATVYRSTGPDGQVVYSDKPPADGKVQKTLNFANLPATPMPDSVLKYRQELEKSLLYNGQRVQGYSRQAYDALFGAAR
jgi:hypothetical protein